MQRREFFSSFNSAFRGDSKAEEMRILRPPYNTDESLFHNECQNCDGICATVCEEDIIDIGEDKTPRLRFDRSGCTFCDECAKACELGVLSLEYKSDVDALINVSVSSCLAWHDTVCFSCKEPCLENAIVFAGVFKPVIDAAKCTACGFCISRCPTHAIEIGKAL